MRLKGKVAIVSGAGTIRPGIGNGRATALLFAKEGAKVACVDKNLSSAQETVDMIKTQGGEAVAVQADVTKERQARELVEKVVNIYGKLDILFNNVGVGFGSAGLKVSEEDWDAIMSTNLKGILFLSKYAIPEMAMCGGGAIVNNSSGASLVAHQIFAYATSKAGVNALTRCLAVSAAKYNVRVNCVAPGLIETPMVQPVMGEKRDNVITSRVPMKRHGKPEEVAYAVLFLASDEASYITGQTLSVDGGVSVF
jgi:NAD(P)-dependent dehydrogenase (short-subunit alcohol dehydrogenase family)